MLQIDQYQHQFGLDSRSAAAVVLMKIGTSQLPLDSAIFAICQQAVREHRKFLTDAVIEFSMDLAAKFGGGPRA